MKNLISILALTLVLFGCNSSDPEDQAPANDYINTTWEAPDEIAQMIYGGTNVQQYEFISGTEVQHIKLRNGSVRNTERGTYSFSGNTVTITIDDTVSTLERSGSLLTSTIRQSTGGFVTYVKK